MGERRISRQVFLERSGFGEAVLADIPNDASSRSYSRFVGASGANLILMDAPPDANLKTDQFIAISRSLAAAGLNVPDIHTADLRNGYVVISDLGRTTARAHLDSAPKDEREIYVSSLDVLNQIEQIEIFGLNSMDPKIAGEMTMIAAEHYAQNPELAEETRDLVRHYFESICDLEPKLALRDFHVENIVWRKDRQGTDRIGLLDYQDAFYAPRGYDFVSLIRDVRRDVSIELREELIDMHRRTGSITADHKLHLHCLAIQRNLRILGVFARLIQVDGKVKYAQFLSRTWRLLLEDLEPAEFSKLRKVILSHFPEPTDELLRQWGVIGR